MERFRASVKIQANIFFSMKLDRVTFFLQLFFRSFWMFLTNFLIRKAGVVPCSFEVSLLDKESPKLQFGLIVRSTGATLFDHGTKWSNSFILSQLFEYFWSFWPLQTVPNFLSRYNKTSDQWSYIYFPEDPFKYSHNVLFLLLKAGVQICSASSNRVKMSLVIFWNRNQRDIKNLYICRIKHCLTKKMTWYEESWIKLCVAGTVLALLFSLESPTSSCFSGAPYLLLFCSGEGGLSSFRHSCILCSFERSCSKIKE